MIAIVVREERTEVISLDGEENSTVVTGYVFIDQGDEYMYTGQFEANLEDVHFGDEGCLVWTGEDVEDE